MPQPEWDAEGQPANLAAAVADTLEWLDWTKRLKPVARDIDLSERLARTRAALVAQSGFVEEASNG